MSPYRFEHGQPLNADPEIHENWDNLYPWYHMLFHKKKKNYLRYINTNILNCDSSYISYCQFPIAMNKSVTNIMLIFE